MTKKRPYKLSLYNKEWAQEFENTKKILKNIIGKEIIAIHHIGSTSIFGMFAKPQIDILVEVKNLSKIKNVYLPMKNAGYTAHGNYTKINEEYFTKESQFHMRTHSVHILECGNPEITPILYFRDYLRMNKNARERYVEKKKTLFNKYPENYEVYDSQKGEFVKKLLEEAREWYYFDNIKK